jgi:hypothetical protein
LILHFPVNDRGRIMLFHLDNLVSLVITVDEEMCRFVDEAFLIDHAATVFFLFDYDDECDAAG